MTFGFFPSSYSSFIQLESHKYHCARMGKVRNDDRKIIIDELLKYLARIKEEGALLVAIIKVLRRKVLRVTL